ncbi:uncharacterized protein SCODWIG_03268 [Saccharomycodes ludwigii]|uniref:Prokaryotic-type class I peptide chain release factors domain-containing protein n=1 Tax=Saccharomycodes ludwigii TaxID=36035 RepID=A0A376BA26_9ASCO|nr:hypothetical protein SCDLUD_000890 [Saccharomycodes ludwigii]KAH3903267.1 hypothetical protein SCDLUD_000890 [Saccharomycodes ludwigii]SSD61507.1 uncharacterized protein SCODWIG_03268 [Saccharomycodes ludwigii]
MEKDIEEKFMHGGRGPGGQKINKSNSKVQLRHIPTGIVVNCQETRSRDKNRKIARLKLAMEIERFKNDDNMSARDIGLLKLNQQNKKSAMKRSQLKHEIHKKENELNRLKQLEDDEELIKKMFK